MIKLLIKNGANIKTYCPQGMKESKWRLEEYKESIEYSENEYKAVTGADATVIVTEWNQFRGMNLRKMKELMNELKATVSRAERFLIYVLGIFSAVGMAVVIAGIILTL